MSEGFERVIAGWRPLPIVSGPTFVDARLQAHWAAQPVAAAGIRFLTHRPDDSHTSMSWLDEQGVLAGDRTGSGHRAALRLSELTLCVADGADRPVASLPLEGKTLADALTWMGDTLGEIEGSAERSLTLPGYELPQHGAGRGAAFSVEARSELEHLSNCFADAAALAQAVRTTTGGASPVRCWPHHFDIATLIALDPDQPGAAAARSINVGLSPGDDAIREPYFYVTPWPVSEATKLGELDGGGSWHREGWTGAVLRCGALESTVAQAQAEQVVRFVRSAIAASRLALGAS